MNVSTDSWRFSAWVGDRGADSLAWQGGEPRGDAHGVGASRPEQDEACFFVWNEDQALVTDRCPAPGQLLGGGAGALAKIHRNTRIGLRDVELK